MLVRFLVIAGAVTAAAVFIPDIAATYLAKSDDAAASARPVPADSVSTAKYAGGKGSRLSADATGHFFGDFNINGRKERGLVDTGASMIAISESTARRLGVAGSKLDFRYAVDTANGRAKAAHVILDEVGIGTVSVRNVDAMVLKDGALATTLVGMSFLNALSSYQVSDGTLLLVR